MANKLVIKWMENRKVGKGSLETSKLLASFTGKLHLKVLALNGYSNRKNKVL